MRCAIVASGTRNARGDLAVVRPPTARRVSAICDGGGERGVAAQEQQRQRVVLVGRRLAPAGTAPAAPPRVSSRRRRACSLRSSSVSRRDGDGDQPAARVVGHALARPLHGGGEQRLLHRVLARVEAPVAADEHAEDLRRQLAQQVLDARVRSSHLRPAPRP